MTTLDVNVLKSLNERTQELKNLKPADMAAPEYLKGVLFDEVEGMTKSEAEDIVKQIEEGITAFNTNYEASLENGQATVDEILTNAMSGMTTEQQFDYLAAIIVAAGLKAGQVPTNDDISIALNEATEGMDKTPEAVEKLKLQALQALNDNPLFSIDENTAREMAEADFDADSIRKAVDDASTPLFMAVAAYIASKKGDIELPDEYADYRTLGTGIASALRQAQLTADLKDGKITEKTWVKCVKIVLGVTLALALGFAAFVVAEALAMGLFLAGVMILGSSTISTIIAIVIAMGGVAWAGWQSADGVMKLADLYSKLFDKAAEWMAETYPKVAEQIKEWKDKAVEYIKNLKDKNKKENKNEVEEPSGTEIVTDSSPLVTA